MTILVLRRLDSVGYLHEERLVRIILVDVRGYVDELLRARILNVVHLNIIISPPIPFFLRQ